MGIRGVGHCAKEHRQPEKPAGEARWARMLARQPGRDRRARAVAVQLSFSQISLRRMNHGT
jgi:hypothetical protein